MEPSTSTPPLDIPAIQDILGRNRAHFSRFGVREIFLFGSRVRGEAGGNSDIDFLVDFAPNARVGLFEFVRFRELLSDLLNARVDLVTRDALHPALKKDILGEAIRVA